MVYIRPFKKEDIYAFEPLEPNMEPFSNELAQAVEDSDLAVTGLRNGIVVGCGGVHPGSNGHGEMWLRLSRDCLEHKLDTLRWLKDGLAIIEKNFSFRQLNATIQCCFEQSIKLVKYLGFVPVQVVDNKWMVFSKRIK